MTTPRRTAALLVRGSTLALPAGEARDRYRQEFLAELHKLEPSRQLGHAWSLTVHAIALRRAVTGAEQRTPALASSHKPLHCRLHLWHHHRTASTQDGEVYVACIDCGHVKDNYPDPAYPSISSRGLPIP